MAGQLAPLDGGAEVTGQLTAEMKDGWLEYTCSDGEKFYHHPNKNLTQWEHPLKAPLAVALLSKIMQATGGNVPGGGGGPVQHAKANLPLGAHKRL
eukprot:CAMPEP_0179115690 /NCGR_PEP_ID=MMETSP0796-20121207/54227_1 /TAXON_ID=73915 /ORGANISM="Pyrodinium bahamense, Strain pbaha01" /LENGTH=95 /DNA_ID=CAMNT_0020813943 /DNA_START=73 /DNA_END=360 /DNA_ORIENTATION=-